MDEGLIPDFHGVVKGKVKPQQPMPVSAVKATAKEATDKLKAFLIDCNINIPALHKILVGEVKDDETATNKAKRDYGGDESFVVDRARCKAVVTTPQEVLTIQQMVEDPHNPILKRHGFILANATNFFEDPKEPTGHRALRYVLAVPVTGGHQLTEFQVTAQQLEDVYEITHKHKRAMEDIYTEAVDRELNVAERMDVSYHKAQLDLINGTAAMPYHCLVKPHLARKYDMTPVRQKKLEDRINWYEKELYY